ncbi:ferritin-like domain-containing protein [Symmachiella dynata]|uniref:ferritin-like domain-containing protein n=1 Tax=Symmachiella dynata TaxID=2527995 RepID=UPI0011AA68C7|nr:DUF455 family protein [Symmachiella dynata]
MEIRDFAQRILQSDSLAEKLRPLEGPATDRIPGPPQRFQLPARPAHLKFAGRKEAPAMPAPAAFRDPAKRAVAHHIMANHELQALEVMAFTLCAFPDAPTEFRHGMLPIMADEQRHTRMHAQRLEEFGMTFGDLPVNGYFWLKAQDFQSPLDYLAGLPLTFEAGNLDHTIEFEQAYEAAGDKKGAGIMRAIHQDEIGHVAFGIHWLRAMKPADQTDWDAYIDHLHWPLRPEKAKGKAFQRQPRLEAGLTDEFIDQIQHAGRDDLR